MLEGLPVRRIVDIIVNYNFAEWLKAVLDMLLSWLTCEIQC